jgi:hypothetical protein
VTEPTEVTERNGIIMRNSKIYRRYAEECRRLAMTMPQEHREALFRLAEAWIMVAQEAEREARSEDADV